MKKLFLVFTFLTSLSFVYATHGVGGDIQFVQTGANTYNVNVRLFRFLSGANILSTQTIEIFDRSTCIYVTSVTVNEDTRFLIPFGDECYAPGPGTEVQQIEFSSTVTLANNPNGYRAQWDLCCRPNNLTNISSGGIALYTEIPDPALTSGNSSPRFVNYPTDGYFCVFNTKCINFSAIDPDGDSLSYELVNPIQGFSACVPSYVAYKPLHDLNNILGPGSSCVIDPMTGCVWAQPSALGTYVISVKCTEWRNGVKIGELIRDLQYYALNCTFDLPPSFDIAEDEIILSFDKDTCFGVLAVEQDLYDTFLLSVVSNAFDYGATASTSADLSYTWTDSSGNITTTNNVAVNDLGGNVFEGVGKVGIEFCWNPSECDVISVDSFYVQFIGYSIGCSGPSDSLFKNIPLKVIRAEYDHVVPNVFSPNGDGINDKFFLQKDAYDRCYDLLNIRIYNRWGQLVFESDNAQFEWDGTDLNGNELSSGTYFALIQGFYSGDEVTQNFPVTLFR